jgi:hypothetical protein
MLRPNPAIRADATSLLAARETSLIRMVRAARQRMLNRFLTTPFHCEVSHSVPKRPHCDPQVQPNSRARLAVICWFACVSLLLATAPVLWKGLIDERSFV